MPDFSIYVDRLGIERRPHYITIRQLATGDQIDREVDGFVEVLNYLENISTVLQTVIRQRVQAYQPTVQNISGYLSGLDENNAQVGESYRVDSINEITPQLLESILIQVQSRDELTIETVTWRFTIDQARLIVGGAQNVKIPAYVSKTMFAKTWAYHGVNCAAFAITHSMNHSKRWPLERTIRNAMILQNDLQWGVYVSFDQILRQIPLKFPDYRITIIVPNVFNFYNSAQGVQFNHSTQKYIYLVYDCSQKHYGSTLYPAQIFRNLTKNNDYRACFECNTLFTVRTGHECAITTLPPAATNKRKQECNYFCRSCKETVFFIHDCCETKCRSCPLNYKKVYY
jgi:hypothetical protein